jgi:hypothetical protein
LIKREVEISFGFSQIVSQVFEGNTHGLQKTLGLGSHDRGVAGLGRECDGSR